MPVLIFRRYTYAGNYSPVDDAARIPAGGSPNPTHVRFVQTPQNTVYFRLKLGTSTACTV